MRKFILGLSCLFLLAMAACSCTLESQAIDKIQSNTIKMQADHKALMQKVGRSADEQKDWDGLYQSTQDALNNLKKAAGK